MWWDLLNSMWVSKGICRENKLPYDRGAKKCCSFRIISVCWNSTGHSNPRKLLCSVYLLCPLLPISIFSASSTAILFIFWHHGMYSGCCVDARAVEPRGGITKENFKKQRFEVRNIRELCYKELVELETLKRTKKLLYDSYKIKML